MNKQRKRRRMKREVKKRVWKGPPVKIYTDDEKRRLEHEIRANRPNDIPQDWYNALPTTARCWLGNHPDIKEILRSNPADAGDFNTIIDMRRKLHQYCNLRQWQIDMVLAIISK